MNGLNAESSAKFGLYGETTNTYDNGSTRTIVSGVTDGEAWIYDKENPQLLDTRSEK